MRKISRRSFLAICGAAALTGALSACGGSEPAAVADPGNTDQTEFTIVGGQSALSPGYADNTVLNEMAQNAGISITT